MARGGGYYLPLNKNNKGVSELVGQSSHHRKIGKLRRKTYVYRRLGAILEKLIIVKLAD